MTTDFIEQIYRTHTDLLSQIEQSPDPTAHSDAVRLLIEQSRQAGAYVAAPNEREYIQSVLSFWGSWLYRHTRIYPNIDLYPVAPASQRPRPVTPTRVGPQPVQAFAAPPAAVRATGQPFIMATITSPPDGTTISPSDELTLTGMYANLRPVWRLYFMAQDDIGRMTLLDDGFSPAERPDGGTWQPDTPFTAPQPGVYHLGLLLAITPEAITACRDAHATSQPLDTTPSGAIAFADLVALLVR